MFTGIIQAVGKVAAVEPRNADARLVIDAAHLDLSDVAPGDSIACNGVCLTVVALGAASFSVDVSAETFRCTTGFPEHGLVNLEKALRLSDRLGGHLVSGHVDGVGEVLHFAPAGDCFELVIRAPGDLARFVVSKGSITVNGVSLTVNRVDGDRFSINLIPHTLEHTNLHTLQPASRVNLEVDMMARYAERILNYRDQT
ncbi:riboflavin synthase subunit alpha [Sulfuriferula plumbiphila]|uniref:Riboflavin synthase n=1 Tax=Sulfuriferula plumbiphila TaxID=171865 RepID=A0A512LAP4_9PROT|nr:riboflavin synthase [Sulfuriferula plumbiphila]BBP03379.1 riboflavin synthase subunit alpha [Sulfuriferula plumbiphila]GEP31539.1 riboflavin synthase subunit alpha [Sulfuriferula plumbiphila]